MSTDLPETASTLSATTMVGEQVHLTSWSIITITSRLNHWNNFPFASFFIFWTVYSWLLPIFSQNHCFFVLFCNCPSYMSDILGTANTFPGFHLFLNMISSFLTNGRFPFYIIKLLSFSFIVFPFGFTLRTVFLILIFNDSPALS